MSFTQIILLAAVQGISEFLPISSSAHLILVPTFTDFPDQGLVLDVAVHIGTLGAVLVYFWRDFFGMGVAILKVPQNTFSRRTNDSEYFLFLKILTATLPVVIAGFIVNLYLGELLRHIEIIGWATILFGILLFISDKMKMKIDRIKNFTFTHAIVIGMVQVFALIPGTSRSGVTITAARFLGIERQLAARFSLMLSVPVIIGAGVIKGLEIQSMETPFILSNIMWAGGLSFVFALASVSILMAWLKQASFTPFVVYRLLLGSVLLFYAHATSL